MKMIMTTGRDTADDASGGDEDDTPKTLVPTTEGPTNTKVNTIPPDNQEPRREWDSIAMATIPTKEGEGDGGPIESTTPTTTTAMDPEEEAGE